MKHIILLAALSGCFSPSQRTDVLAFTSTALIAADWAQTRGIAANCRESNPFIGECGQRVPVDLWFPLGMAANLLVGYALGEVWGQVWFGAVTGAQASTVVHNALTP